MLSVQTLDGRELLNFNLCEWRSNRGAPDVGMFSDFATHRLCAAVRQEDGS